MDIDLLRRSCERMHRLVELKTPSCVLINELRLLSDYVFDAIQEAQLVEAHHRIKERQELGQLQCLKADAEEGK